MEGKELMSPCEALLPKHTESSCESEDVVHICGDVREEIMRQSVVTNINAETHTSNDEIIVALSPYPTLLSEISNTSKLKTRIRNLEACLDITKNERDTALRELFRVRKDLKAKLLDIQKRHANGFSSPRTEEVNKIKFLHESIYKKKVATVDLEREIASLGKRLEIADGLIRQANDIETRLRSDLKKTESNYASVCKSLKMATLQCNERKFKANLSTHNLALKFELGSTRPQKVEKEQERSSRETELNEGESQCIDCKRNFPGSSTNTLRAFQMQIERLEDEKDKIINYLSEKLVAKQLQCMELRTTLLEFSKDCEDSLRYLEISKEEE